MITANAFAQHILESHYHDNWNEKDKYYLPLPLYHILSLTFVFHIMLCGGTICLGSGERYLKKEIEVFRPQVAVLVPSVLEYLYKREMISNFKTVFTAGSRCTEELDDKIRSAGTEVINFYGSSETIGGTASSRKLESVERLYPCNGVRFCIRENNELGVIVSSHMNGYYKKAEDTKNVIVDNCFWTGDTGILYNDGSICIQGRVRDTIVLQNGEKIHAEDVDDALKQISGVRDGAIIYSSMVGLVAIIILDNEECRSEVMAGIRNYNREHSLNQRIEKIYFQEEEFPRTFSGKLSRNKLENRYFG